MYKGKRFLQYGWRVAIMGIILSNLAIGESSSKTAEDINRQLGRGINLGNALDAPNEGEWGVTLEESYFKLIKKAGFDSVRIPVRWSAHADTTSPYKIETKFMDRVEWAVDQALENKLPVVLNFHHYAEINSNPENELPRFLALWEQVAERFQDKSNTLVFEILNEPTNKLDGPTWNKVLIKVLEVIRRSNPERMVMVGPVYHNSVKGLPELQVPEEDRKLIITVHYYRPVEFTHQGASWVNGSDKWLGTKWPANDKDKEDIIKDFEQVNEWAKSHDRPIYLGEFGAFSTADMDSRVRWTIFVRQQAEKHKMSMAYWEFCSSFGVYDSELKQWRKPLVNALLGNKH